jgi:hypothetical protein
MAPPSTWGPPIWTFLHTLVAKIKENEYTRIAPSLLSLIKKICALLPCPECSQHATIFLNKINMKDIPNKTSFINTLYIFHNSVNYRNKKPLYNYASINTYEKNNLVYVYKNFLRVYNTKGNMNMLNESFRRNFVITELQNWLKVNVKSFY